MSGFWAFISLVCNFAAFYMAMSNRPDVACCLLGASIGAVNLRISSARKDEELAQKALNKRI